MNNEPNLPPTTPSFVPRPQIQNLARQYLSLQLLQPVCLRTFHSTQVPSPSTFDHLPSSSNIPLHPRVRDPRNASPSPPSSSWIQAFSCPLEVFTFLSSSQTARRCIEIVSGEPSFASKGRSKSYRRVGRFSGFWLPSSAPSRVNRSVPPKLPLRCISAFTPFAKLITSCPLSLLNPSSLLSPSNHHALPPHPPYRYRLSSLGSRSGRSRSQSSSKR